MAARDVARVPAFPSHDGARFRTPVGQSFSALADFNCTVLYFSLLQQRRFPRYSASQRRVPSPVSAAVPFMSLINACSGGTSRDPDDTCSVDQKVGTAPRHSAHDARPDAPPHPNTPELPRPDSPSAQQQNTCLFPQMQVIPARSYENRTILAPPERQASIALALAEVHPSQALDPLLAVSKRHCIPLSGGWMACMSLITDTGRRGLLRGKSTGTGK